MTSIAIINGSPVNSGIYVSMRPYCWVLKQLGHHVEWYQCVDDKTQLRSSDKEDHLITGFCIPSEDLRMGFNRFITFPLRLKNIETEIRIIADPTLINALDRKVKSVVFFHDVIPLTKFGSKFSSKVMFRYALFRLGEVDKIIVTSNYTKEQLIYNEVDGKKISIIPYTTRFLPRSDHIEKSLLRLTEARELNVTYVAADRPHKCIELFLEIAKTASTSTGAIKFNFHLISKLRKSTSEKLEKMCLDNFFLHSSVESMENVYDMTDVLLHTSLFEGFGLPILESMCFGIPIIARCCPPVKELLDGNGILVESGFADKWLSVLDSLTNIDTYRRFASLSLKRSTNFSHANFRTNVLDAFESL